MNLFDLSGKVAIVTGGNGGIGLGMARGLTEAGAAVVVAARNEAKSAAAVQELHELQKPQTGGGQAIAITVDAANEDSVQALVAATVEKLGRVDILVNNAGINIRKRPEELQLEEWHQVMDVNLTSAFMCSKAVYPEMKKAGGGKILNNGSMMSLFGNPVVPAYAASKGGIVQLTRALACAWAPDNIQVNAFLPGWIDTDMTQRARKQMEGLNERVLARCPAGRWGNIDEFAGTAVFLASKASDFITGIAMPVDGGYSIQG